MDNKISFIVPVYKVEKYLERCIKSILTQDYKNFELILINDGSPDNSQKIIDKFKAKDKRIISVVKKNEGVSIARNCGLDIATGEYIIFVDSDDFIEPDYASYFINILKHYDGDMALSYNYYDEVNKFPNSNNILTVIDGNEATKQLYLEKTGVAVWNKIYKKRIIDQNNIRFNPKFWFAEGMTFNIEYFQKCHKIVCTNKKEYHQIYNPESAVRKFNIDSWYCGMKAMEYQLQFIKQNKELLDTWNYHYNNYYFSILKGIYMANLNDKYKAEITLCVKHLRKRFLYSFKVSVPIKKKIKCLLISICPILIVKYSIKKENFLKSKV